MSLGAVLGLFISAHASGLVTVSGTNVFTAAGEASVIAYKTAAADGESEEEYYTMFVFGLDGDSISYRRNLAYHWYEAVASDSSDGDGETGTVVDASYAEGFYNMTFGFASASFEKFVIKYDSQQYNKTKDARTTNYIVFFPVGDGSKVNVLITDDEDAELEEGETYTELSAGKLTVSFTEKYAGGYNVKVSDGENAVEGKFDNVGGNYSKYSSATSNTVIPMTFSAKFAEGNDETAKAVLYSLNGQSFKLSGAKYNESGDYYYGGTVTDDCPPVLCLDGEVRYFTLGDEIDFDYAVIDVLRSSPRATVNYYVLSYEQYLNEGEEPIKDYNDTGLFTELSSSDDILLQSGADKYLPAQTPVFTGENADGDLYADMLIKVYVKLTDSTSNGESTNVYLDWYVPAEYKLSAGNQVANDSFIAVAKDNLGATFNYDGKDGKSWADLVAEYQEKVNQAAKNLSAGSSSNIYLPSPESLFADNITAYTDLQISIYYYSSSQSSSTGLASNNLSINLAKNGHYTFTLYATDAAGNNMYYIKDGEVVEFAASEIWTMYEDKDDEGLTEYLPWFEFDVNYTGVEFEKTPGLQSTAYVGTSYTASSFSINGISGSYDVVYSLYLFDRAKYADDTGVTLSYENYVDMLDSLFDDIESRRKYFTEIPALDEMEETDPDYELYSDYEWNRTSTTFVPQDANAFYLVRAEVTDKQYNIPKACNMGIVASVQASSLKGENDWLKNNVASVVLLCVAGVALVGIILLLVIKPKDKGDIDAELENEKNKKKNKKGN